MPIEVAIIAKYSPQRFSSHSPTASMISITAYAPAASASQVRVRELSVNACWMRPSSLEWLTLKPSWRRNARSSGRALAYACSIVIRDAANRQMAMASPPKMIARRNRSTANTRRMNALRSSLSRRTRGAADTEPLAEPGLIGREGDMAAGPAAQQAPVHVSQPRPCLVGLQPAARPPDGRSRRRSRALRSPARLPTPLLHGSRSRRHRSTRHGLAGIHGDGLPPPVAWACGEAPRSAVRSDRPGRPDLGAAIWPGGGDGCRDLDHARAAAPAGR